MKGVRYFYLGSKINGGRCRYCIGRTIGRPPPARYTPAPPGVEWLLVFTKRTGPGSAELETQLSSIVAILNSEKEGVR